MISKNGVALAILIIGVMLKALGIEFDEDTLGRAVEGGVLLISFLLMVWNQLAREDTKWFVLKK